MKDLEYAGFWVRTGASFIDWFLILIIIMPILTLIYGSDYWAGESYFLGFWDIVFNYILPAIAVILFWIYKAATPGKMALRLSIVDAETGKLYATGSTTCIVMKM